MKKRNVSKLLGLLMFVMLAAMVLPRAASAATYTVENGKSYTSAANDLFELPTFASKTEVLIEAGGGQEILYGKYDTQSVLTLDPDARMTVLELDGNSWKFRIKSGSGPISFTWAESNDSAAKATPFSLKTGETKKINDAPKFRYYLLEVTDPSAKYTFTTENDVTHIEIIHGKTDTYASANVEEKVDQGKSGTFVFKKGFYTICGTAISKNVQFTVKREDWVGITKITPSNKGVITNVIGNKFKYTVNYEPKNANSEIRVESVQSAASTRMKLISQKNGVATFEVDFPFDDDNKQWTTPYKKDENSRQYNKVRFVSEEGVTAEAEKKPGPKAPTVYGTLTGSTKAVSIPVQGQGNKYVAYYKNGKKWKKCGETTTNDNGIYYVKCTGLKPGKSYTFRVYAYSDGVKGGYLDVKGITAYNLKPTKVKATCTKTVFHQKKKSYEWRFDWNRGWYKTYFTDYSRSTVKVTYKAPKASKDTYVTVNGTKLKSGKTITVDLAGRTAAGTKTTIIVQSVRKSGNCIAYGPSVTVNCSLKAAK